MLAEADIEARLASASDEEIMRLHEAMRVVREGQIVAELQSLPHDERKARFGALQMDDATRERIRVMWREVWARPSQLPPERAWQTWLALAGRGYGKTEMGAQWIRERVAAGARHIALVAETQKDLEEVMVARLLTIHPKEEAPTVRFKPVRLVWPNGAVALGYNGTEPDQLRGPQFDTAWVDELAKYAKARETWDMLTFTMRSGADPRVFVTTTPRPIPVLREIIANPSTAKTTGTTLENAANLAPKFLGEVLTRYKDTRLGRQELYAEVLDDFPGALWTREMLDQGRVTEAPEMVRIVVAVDPSGTKGEATEQANDVGIMVVGLGIDGRGYILADRTCNLSPDGWARRAIAAYYEFEADTIVAETNYGGAMVESTIRSQDDRVPFTEVRASRGKWIRAEPVASLFEQDRVSVVGSLPELEDQMMMLTSAGFEGEGSPDRVDSMVWGVTELMLTGKHVFAYAAPEFSVDPFVMPAFWPRGFAMKIEGETTFVLFAAFDKAQDVLYIVSEHTGIRKSLSDNAGAIKARGAWLPGTLETDETNLEARQHMLAVLGGAGLTNLMLADRSFDSGIAEMDERLRTGRLKVFSTCSEFFRAYRSFMRDDKGEIKAGGMMDCARLLSQRMAVRRMIERPKTMLQQVPIGGATAQHSGDSRVGY